MLAGALIVVGCVTMGVGGLARPAAATTPPAPSAPPGVAAALPPAQFTAQDSEAVRTLIRNYFAAFTAKRFALFDEYFTAPFMMAGATPRLLPTLADVVRAWRGIRERLDPTDYATSQATEIRVIPVTPERALANIHWKRFTRDGALMSEGAEFYFVTRQSGQWKINGVMEQQLALFGR
jgi:hypothetical protein